MRSDWTPRRMHVLEAFEQQIAFALEQNNQRLLNKIGEQYIYSVYDHLLKAEVIYQKELRRKLRTALKQGREYGFFIKAEENLWAYEAAYPCKVFWWLRSKLQRIEK